LHIRRNRDRRQEIANNPAFKTYFSELVDKDEVSLDRRLKTSKTKNLLAQLGKTKTKQLLTSTKNSSPEKDLNNSTHPLNLLLYPRFCVRHPVNDKEVIQPNFEETVIKGFKLLQPFNDFLGEVLY
jgi:hypothetical protein